MGEGHSCRVVQVTTQVTTSHTYGVVHLRVILGSIELFVTDVRELPPNLYRWILIVDKICSLLDENVVHGRCAFKRCLLLP